MQETLEQNQLQERNYQRYIDYEQARRLTDELTEASEKMSAAMRNTFEFELRSDGELYFQDGSVGEVLRKSVITAEEIVLSSPQFLAELIRRRIELQEYDEQRKLALGSVGDPDVLVVLSPIPDAVMNGVDLGAYDKTRMKTLARVYERTDRGIRSTSLSLDRSDRRGLQAIARQFGGSISDDDGSEDILAMRFWGHSSVLNDPTTTVRRLYDDQLSRQFGGEWYAGRQDDEVLDALQFIKQQGDIVDAHMKRMQDIDDMPVINRKALYREARYDFAAALDRRKSGGTTLGDGGDLSGSGGAARESGIEYNGDCPTGSGEGQANTAQEATNKLFGEKIVTMTCPYCGLKTIGDPCAFRLVCGKCDAEVRGGRIMSKGIGRTAALERLETKKQIEQKKIELAPKVAKAALAPVFEQGGKYFKIEERIGIGAMIQEVREITREEFALVS